VAKSVVEYVFFSPSRCWFRIKALSARQERDVRNNGVGFEVVEPERFLLREKINNLTGQTQFGPNSTPANPKIWLN
jgi:hypothetical protein